MSHNLNFSEELGRHSFFSVRERAWHELGIVLEGAPTAEEAIKLAGLDFQVAKKEATIEFNGQQRTIPRKYATYRTDNGNPFGIVGDIYTIIQNTNAFSFFDQIVGKGEAIYETAGCLNQGEIVFITAKLPDYISVLGKDHIEKYLFLVNYHDGKGPLLAALTPVRIVCNNTLNAALQDMEMKITIRHTTNFEKSMEEAPRIMGIVNKLSKELEDVYNQMARKKLVDADLREMITRTLATPATLNKIDNGEEATKQLTAKVDKVLEYVFSSETQQMDTTKGTVWGAYNAITGYFQNVKKWKSAEKQFDSIFHGSGSLNAQRVFDMCVEKIK